jgi:hypothetical protein
MQSVKPNSNVLLPTTPTSNVEACCSRTTTIAVAIIASLAGFLLLPLKLAIGLSVIVLGAAAYYTCSPKIDDTPTETTELATCSPKIDGTLTETAELATIFIWGAQRQIRFNFNTTEARTLCFSNSCLKQLAFVSRIVSDNHRTVLCIAYDDFKVLDILSILRLHHPKEGRPTKISLEDGNVICELTTPNTTPPFVYSDIAKELNTSAERVAKITQLLPRYTRSG